MNRAERKATFEAIQKLDRLTQDAPLDPEACHGQADDILLNLVDPEVKAAYERVVAATPGGEFWYA